MVHHETAPTKPTDHQDEKEGSCVDSTSRGYDHPVESLHAQEPSPRTLHLDRQRGLHVTFHDGTVAFLSLQLLRRMSPSAEARTERESMAKNPLHVLSPRAGSGGPLTATGAELVGHYAIRIRFSDGHDTGLYGWSLLRELASQAPASSESIAMPTSE